MFGLRRGIPRPLFQSFVSRLRWVAVCRSLSAQRGLHGSPKISRQLSAHKTSDSSIPDFAFVFDIDGVLVRGKTALPKARDTLEYLNHERISFLLLTNGGGTTEEQRAEDLGSELGVPLDASMIVQSHTPFRDMHHHKDGCALIIGGKGDQGGLVADGYGFKNVVTPSNILRSERRIWPLSSQSDDYRDGAKFWKPHHPMPNIEKGALKIDSIFVFNDPRDWGLDLVLIMDCLLSKDGVLGTLSPKNGNPALPNQGYQQDGQPPLYFSNDDLWYAAQFPLPRLGQGGFRAACEGVWTQITGGIEKGVELKKTIIGKPHKLTYDFAEKQLNAMRQQRFGTISSLPPLKRIYMVGDNPESDIRGAENYTSPWGTRWLSALLRTGVYAGGTPSVQPTVITDDVNTAIHWAVKHSKWQNT